MREWQTYFAWMDKKKDEHWYKTIDQELSLVYPYDTGIWKSLVNQSSMLILLTAGLCSLNYRYRLIKRGPAVKVKSEVLASQRCREF
ncbi:Short-chain dehydrogenase/reductase SDR [Penicillium concentricum]|uniref:Short-chain dehydrogenase/reductase SDR n=1 Tax=Penicillium concentricum TaxID=293559 RepID=A0A9W9SCX6_9EURO|nr:Short-chain dehydrogenase/reductase SDR [Penicillium concentricum]KAJ5375269.1 Short-chain dehydrogenase/reductase SDR [Penicillium concentricum]